MSWASRRKTSILLIIIVVIITPFIAFGVYYFIQLEPTCFDDVQNGNEEGVDCGGSCSLVCQNEIISPIVQWTRFIEVSDGVYKLIAYVENQNPSSAAKNVPYSFQLYENSIELTSRKGTVDIPAQSAGPVVQTDVFTNQRDPTRVSFALDKTNWQRAEPPQYPFSISNERVVKRGDNPRISAIIENDTLDRIKNIELMVLVYGQFDNLMNHSSTYIESLPGSETQEIFFTWNRAFESNVTNIEIIPKYKKYE